MNTQSSFNQTSFSKEETNSLSYRNEQVDMVFRQLPTGYLSDFVTGAFLSVLLAYMGSGMAVYIWYAVLCIATLIRMIILRYLEANDHSIQTKMIFLVVASMIGGTIWGLSWLIVLPDPSFMEIAVVGLWISGMLAGAVTTIAVIKSVFFAFAIPASVLFIICTSICIDKNAYLYSGTYLMYLCFIIPIAIRISNDLNRGIKLKIRNSNLQVQLQQDALRLKEKEDEFLIRQQMEEKPDLDQVSKIDKEEDSLILNSVNEGIYGINHQGKISFINASALELLGFKRNEIIGQSAYKLINRYDSILGEDARPNLSIISSFRDGNCLQNVDSIFCGQDGSSIPVRFSCKPVKKNSRVIGTVVSFSDLSKQKEMESMLFQAQKMEAVGRLTGGVSHDFNNLLTVIIGNIHFLQKRLQSDLEATALLDKIMNAAKSGAELSNRLLSFSREQALVKAPLDIAEMLYEMREFLDRIIGEDITLEVRLKGDKCIAMTDRNQLENAIFNLCINARDAMPDGGKLTIVARHGRSEDILKMPGHERIQNGYIVISITDTGTGMSQDIQEKIFDPFFTTKEKHRGTGLGLSSVYGFLKQSGGNIIVNSEEDLGTMFTLFIPVAEANQLPELLIKPSYKSTKKHSGTILVVEDDDSVRDIAGKMLIDAGFSVISAKDGPSGLREFEAHMDKIDLVFSDVIMPGGMTGILLAQRILEKNIEMPIVLATGHTEKVLKDHISGFDNVVFVKKPYNINELPEVIHSLIEKTVEKALPS